MQNVNFNLFGIFGRFFKDCSILADNLCNLPSHSHWVRRKYVPQSSPTCNFHDPLRFLSLNVTHVYEALPLLSRALKRSGRLGMRLQIAWHAWQHTCSKLVNADITRVILVLSWDITSASLLQNITFFNSCFRFISGLSENNDCIFRPTPAITKKVANKYLYTVSTVHAQNIIIISG